MARPGDPRAQPPALRGNPIFTRLQEEIEVYLARASARELFEEVLAAVEASPATLTAADLRQAIPGALPRALTGRCPPDVALEIKRRLEQFVAELEAMGVP